MQIQAMLINTKYKKGGGLGLSLYFWNWTLNWYTVALLLHQWVMGSLLHFMKHIKETYCF